MLKHPVRLICVLTILGNSVASLAGQAPTPPPGRGQGPQAPPQAPQVQAPQPRRFQMIHGTGPYKGPGGFDRGMQSTMHCGNDPESWVRGSATLDQSTGLISMTVQLETDSTTAGPKGRVTATLKDDNGQSLATAVADDLGIGGKGPGRAVIRNFSSEASVPSKYAQQATSLYVEAQCTGRINRLWNIRIGDVKNAFDIAVKLIAAL